MKAKQPIARLIDHSRIEMTVNIPENMIYWADYLKAAGKSQRVRFDPYPELEIEAEIKELKRHIQAFGINP